MTSSVTQILGWLPNWGIVIGEWGSMGAQVLANRVTHAHAYSRDTAAAGMCPVWWDNGGSGKARTPSSTEPLALRPSRQLSMQLSRERKRVLRIQDYATSANP